MAKGIAHKSNGVLTPVTHQEDDNIAYEVKHGEIAATPKIPLFEKVKGTVTVKNPLDPLEEKSFTATLTKSIKGKTDRFKEIDPDTNEITETEVVIYEEIFALDLDTPFAAKPVVAKKSDIDMVALQAIFPVEDYVFDKNYIMFEIESLQYVLPYFYDRAAGMDSSELSAFMKTDIWIQQESVRGVLRAGYIGLVGAYGKTHRFYRLFGKTDASFTMHRMMQIFNEAKYTLHPEDRFKNDAYYINMTNPYSDGDHYDLQIVFLWYDVEFVKYLQNGDENDQALELLDYLYQEGKIWAEAPDPEQQKHPLFRNEVRIAACGFTHYHNEGIFYEASPPVYEGNWDDDEVVNRYWFGAYDLVSKIAQQQEMKFSFYNINQDKYYVPTPYASMQIPIKRLDEMLAKGMVIGVKANKIPYGFTEEAWFLALNGAIYTDSTFKSVGGRVEIVNGRSNLESHDDESFRVWKKLGNDIISGGVYDKTTNVLLNPSEYGYLYPMIVRHLGSNAVVKIEENGFSLSNNIISGTASRVSVVKEFASYGFAHIPTISLSIETPKVIEVGWKTKTQYAVSGTISEHWIDYLRGGIIGKSFNNKNYEVDIASIDAYFDPAIDFISGARKIDGRITPQGVLAQTKSEDKLLLLRELLSYSEYHDDFAGSYVSFVSNIMNYDLKRSALEEDFDLTTLKLQIDGNVISVPMQNPAIVELKQMAQAVYQKLKSEASTHFPESCAKYAAYQVFASNVSRLDISLWSIGHVLMEYHEDWHCRFYYDGQPILTYVYSINDSVFSLFDESGYHPVDCTLTALEETPYQTDEAVAVMQNFVFNLDGSVEFDISFESLETGEPIAKPDFVKYINLNNGVALFGGE
jgi:hypothetical protein